MHFLNSKQGLRMGEKKIFLRMSLQENLNRLLRKEIKIGEKPKYQT